MEKYPNNGFQIRPSIIKSENIVIKVDLNKTYLFTILSDWLNFSKIHFTGFLSFFDDASSNVADDFVPFILELYDEIRPVKTTVKDWMMSKTEFRKFKYDKPLKPMSLGEFICIAYLLSRENNDHCYFLITNPSQSFSRWHRGR